MPKAYHYIRFSNPEQKEGDSFDRQVRKAESYCNKHGLLLAGQFIDEGVSGFTGQNRKEGDLRKFIEAVDTGRIEAGSILLIENMDRFSREDPLDVLVAMRDLQQKGIKIIILDKDSEVKLKSYDSIMPWLESLRANEESKRKSQLLSSAWAKKKANASKKIITRRVPLWLKVVGEKEQMDFEFVPGRKEIVRRIFKLSAQNIGANKISRIFNHENVPSFGKTNFWYISYIRKILTNPATYGAYIPHKGRAGSRVQDGDPIEDYYPPCITKEEFCAAKTYRQDRQKKGGRDTHTAKNLFSSLVYCETCGGKMAFQDKHEGNLYYACAKASLGGNCRFQSVRYKELEAKILAHLPDMLGFEENEQQDSGEEVTIEMRQKLHEVRAAKQNLLEIAKGTKVDIPELTRQLDTLQRDEEAIYAEINRRIGQNERMRDEKANRSELKRNILQILEGDFQGILAGPQDAQRLRLKHHLAKIIKQIRIQFQYLPTMKMTCWIPKVLLHSGQEIIITGNPEAEIFTRENNQRYEEGGAFYIEDYLAAKKGPDSQRDMLKTAQTALNPI